ncbi:MAG: tRNA (adenosine(37)-N6)-threonylcarbamoyltransferase complex dimerization subunit type 1 TsaB [Jatrophihabitantaceae bacterium]
MLVLAIDTSTPTVTAGVVRLKRPHEIAAGIEAEAAALGFDPPASWLSKFSGDPCTVLAECSVTDSFGHAEHLMPLVTAALAEAGHRIGELGAVVVGIGPGPFTGLRVGMATAAALGDALGIPVHGVPSHDGVANAMGSAWGFLVVSDARRREVYVSGYDECGARRFGPLVIAPAALPALLAEQASDGGSNDLRWMTGAGAELLAGHVDLPIRPLDRQISRGLVEQVYRELVTEVVPGPLSPLYLRRPDATEPGAAKSVLGAVSTR